jgi:hypothetical protein
MKVVLLVLGGLGCLGLLLVLVCAGFGWFGLKMVKDQAQVALQQNPVIQEHIGEIESIEMNVIAAGAQGGAAGGGGAFVFDLVGSKGSGQAAVELDTTAGVALRRGTLTIAGETFELVAEGELPALPPEEDPPLPDEPDSPDSPDSPGDPDVPPDDR